MKLLIGNKNYSSWSLRAWLLLRHAAIPFDEERLSFNDRQFKEKVLRHSPAGRVPVLIDGALAVWDSLAIAEYVAEKFADRQLWPADAAARARARAACAEMHSGFGALRASMPMNVSTALPGRGWNVEVQRDIDRLCGLWRELRERHGHAGPFLLGAFSVADAYFAPVIWRFNSYRPELPAAAQAYVRTMLDLPAMQVWAADAAAENDFVDFDEPYRLPA
jgi:glutathione S-transferase